MARSNWYDVTKVCAREDTLQVCTCKSTFTRTLLCVFNLSCSVDRTFEELRALTDSLFTAQLS